MKKQLRSLPGILSTAMALFALTLIAQNSPAQQVLEGHTDALRFVAYSPDGQTIASGGRDGTIRIWNADTGAHLQTLEGHTGAVMSAEYSPDGQTLASGGGPFDGTIRTWNVNTGENLQTIQLNVDSIWSVAYSPDGQTIASGGIDIPSLLETSLYIWDANTGEQIWSLPGHSGWIWDAAYSPDGQTIASASFDTTVHIWDPNTGEFIRSLQGHTDSVLSVAYSPDGQTLASSDIEGVIRIWDPNTGENIRTIKAITGPIPLTSIWGLAYSPDGQKIASGGNNNMIQVWDANTGEQIRVLQGHTDAVLSVAYSPDGQKIASASGDSTIRIWDISRPTATVSGPSGAQTGAFNVTIAFNSAVTGFTLSDIVVTNGSAANLAGSGAAYTATIEPTRDNRVTVSIPAGAVQNKNGKPNTASNTYETTINRHVLKGHEYSILSVAYSPGGQAIASSDGGGTIRIWDAKTGAHLRTLQGHTGPVESVAYSPDGLTIASASHDNTILTWDAKTGEHLRTLQGHTSWVHYAAYSPDGHTIASASTESMRIWDAKTGAHLRTLHGHTNWVYSVAYSPDSQTIASASADKTIRIWNPNTGAQIRTLQGHTSLVYSVAYSPDGQTIASASADKTIRIWNPNTGAQIRTLQGHTGPVESAAYSPDGQTIASASADKTIRIWDAKTGAQMRTLQGHTGPVESAAYSPDGQTIASGGVDRAIRIWAVSFRLTPTVSGPSGTQTGAFDVTIKFSSAVTGFESSDIAVTNGSATNLAGSGAAYTATIEPTSDGNVTVSIPAGAAQDASGKTNEASNTYEAAYDSGPPTVAVTGPEGPVTDTPIEAAVEFSEDVTGFDADDVSIEGGTAASVSGSGKAYTVSVDLDDGFEGALTISIAAGAAQDASGNKSSASNTYSVQVALSTSFTVELRKGLNMLHVPVNDPRLKRLSDLYAVLGGSQDVQFLVAYSSESNLFIAYADGLAGYDLPLSDETAVLASMKSATSVTFTGGLLKREVPLRAGINMVGVTRAGAVETIGGLAALSTVPLNVIALKVDKFGNALFQLATASTDAAKGGEGYIVFAEAETVLTFDGGAWKNEPSSAAAPVNAAAYDPSSTPLLVAEGSIAREDNLTPLNGLEVSITNLQTGQTASDLAGRSSVSGRFSLPLLALTGDSYAVGDAFDLRVSDSSGAFGGVRTVCIVLDKETASSGRIDIGQLLATAIPTESSLLPNYPNPFNPETWIPFDLSEASRVKLTIYNAAGQTVRVLELGELPAGAYRSRAKAAHWDGRNALGEPAASGIYFVRIEAGSFLALRRMVVLK